MLQVLNIAALALLTLCALLSWIFVFRYSRVRWYATAEGRHLMKFTLVLALMFSLTLMGQVIAMKPETGAVLSVALFGWAAYELGNRIRLQVRAQREYHRAKAEEVR